MSETMAPARPGVVTFVGVVLYIKAVVAVVVGIALILERNNSPLQSVTGQDSDFLLWTGIGEIAVGVLLFFVASSVMAGTKWGRLLVAIVVGIRLVVLGYWLVAHLGGGIHWNAVINAGIGIFVLWALYGNEKSQAFYAGHP